MVRRLASPSWKCWASKVTGEAVVENSHPRSYRFSTMNRETSPAGSWSCSALRGSSCRLLKHSRWMFEWLLKRKGRGIIDSAVMG
jgi:hypothetical protein